MKIPGFLFCLCFILRTFAGPGDSLLRLSDLTFKNAQEKSTFKNFQALGEKADVIDLFMAHYTKSESYNATIAHHRIEEAVAELKNETRGFTDQKKVKHIYKFIHRRFFRMYRRDNSFPDIFEKGEYNCVSGSAMYAIIFHLMNIPYLVVEAPQHVFLFAYPKTHKIMIETTSPNNGYLSFSDAYIERYITYMKDSKLISREETERSSASELFNKYYFSKNGLSIQELAGIQYANYTYYDVEAQQYEKALQESEKAYYLCPNERNSYMLRITLMHLVSNIAYKEQKDFNSLVLLCRFNGRNKNDVSDEAVRQEFRRLTYDLLINASDYANYEKAFAMIRPEIKDSALKDEVTFIYHYELARLGISNFKNREYELEHLEAAYKANPKNADLQAMIKLYFLRLVEGNVESAAVMKEMEVFALRFGFLKEDEAFNTIKANCHLELAYQAFTLQEIVVGNARLQEFEKICDAGKNIKASEHLVEKAYSSAATYYFKKGNKIKTRELLKRGLSHAPENFGLQVRLSQVH